MISHILNPDYVFNFNVICNKSHRCEPRLAPFTQSFQIWYQHAS